MTILLDTSVIIDALRMRGGRREFLEFRNQAGDALACSAISVAEVYAGMRPTERAETEEYLENFACIEVTQQIARLAGSLKYGWARKGVTIDITDFIIAATALVYDLRLVTDNRKDFPNPELKHLDLPTN
jgi:hypothetical protein